MTAINSADKPESTNARTCRWTSPASCGFSRLSPSGSSSSSKLAPALGWLVMQQRRRLNTGVDYEALLQIGEADCTREPLAESVSVREFSGTQPGCMPLNSRTETDSVPQTPAGRRGHPLRPARTLAQDGLSSRPGTDRARSGRRSLAHRRRRAAMRPSRDRAGPDPGRLRPRPSAPGPRRSIHRSMARW